MTKRIIGGNHVAKVTNCFECYKIFSFLKLNDL